MYSGRRRHRSHFGLSRSDAEVQEATPENLRIEIDIIFKDFLQNPDVSEYIFPSNLNNLQRKYIHEKAKIMNIVSKSYGNPPNRKLHIKKKPKSPSCHSFGITPCDESLAVLCEFLDTTEVQNVHSLRPEPSRPLNDKVFSKLTDLPPNYVQPYEVPEALVHFKANLPVTPMREEILAKIRKNQVLILSSETGSGKTTQIPQFLLDEMQALNLPCKIICTQPRRISTVSVAERVAEERGEYVGETVGYHIRLEQKYGFCTNLIYCTNGVLLRSLMCGSKILGNMTHLIIDEIHERDRLSDFLLICLKQNLHKFPNIRVILMSATVNVEKFRNYFTHAEVITLPGRQFPIQEYFLDDILVNLNYMSPAMQLLKSRGGDIEIPISSICEYQNIAMDQALDEYMRCSGDFMQASAQLSMYILSEGISVDYQHSTSGMTALMVAAYFGDENLISQLLTLEANLNIQCRNGKTALDYALEAAQDRAFNMLAYYKNSLEQPNLKNPSKELLTLYDKTVSDEEIDYDLIITLLKSIHASQQEGAILIFLPGYDDIMICNDRIMDSGLDKRTFKVFFLHGSMNIRDQHEVFKHIPQKRKIILSTNIAETSITIDDVVFVIDCGKAKEKSYDSYNRLSSLQTQWISQACVKQRAGRAGRTRPGVCFHMFSQQRFFNMDKERVPEILRVSLEELCLHTKILAPINMNIFTFLAQAPDPPSANSVKVAIECLQALGALDEQENLTKLGEYLAQLTIDPRLGKMLINSVVFRCLEPILTLTAALAHKDPFQLPPQANLKSAAAEKRRALTQEVPSDHLIYLKAFIKWQEDCMRGKGIEFCRDHFISKSTMETILDTRRQLLGQLRASGFIPQANALGEFNRYADSWPIIKAVISSGLYPNLAFPNGSAYSTRTEKKVFIPNTSVLGKNKVNAWIVFDEPIKNKNNFYIRGNTAVSPITVSLICGNQTDSVCDTTFIIDKWLEIEGLNEGIFQFRIALKHLVDRVLNNPTILYSNSDYKVLETLQKVLLNEDISLQLPQAIGIGGRPLFLHSMADARNNRNRQPTSDNENPQFDGRYRRNHHSHNGDVDHLSRNFQNGFGFPERFERYRNIPDSHVYILIKSRQLLSINIAYQKNSWTFAPHTEKKILFYRNKGKEVFLVFTVHNSNFFHGIAQFVAIDKVNHGKPISTLHWLHKMEIPYIQVKHLRNPYNDERPIYEGVDGQLIKQSVAEELVRVFCETKQQLSTPY